MFNKIPKWYGEVYDYTQTKHEDKYPKIERVIVFINARIPKCLYPNTEYIRQVKYPNWRRYKLARIPKDYTQRTWSRNTNTQNQDLKYDDNYIQRLYPKFIRQQSYTQKYAR